MKLLSATLSLGLAIAAVTSAPAMSADWNNGAGGLKDLRGTDAVPVPAPIPVYEAPTRWYFRADIGLGMGADPAVKHGGMTLGAAGGAQMDAPSAWFHPDFNTFVNWGLGVGYIINPSWRLDMTWDIRSQGTVTANATYATADGTATGSVWDRTLYRSNVVLFNAYYDFQRYSAFVPYIGAGLGFSVNEIERTSRGTVNDIANATSTSWSEYNRNHDVSLAAAATVGVTYNLNPSIALDFNYRYMYIGGSEAALTTGGSDSHLSVGDIHEHQLRAGARFNVY